MEMREITREAVTIGEEASFREAVALMIRKQTNSLLVVNENGELTGELGVSDLLDAIVPMSMDGDGILDSLGTEAAFGEAVKNASDKAVGDFMNADIQPVQADDSLIAIAGIAVAHQSARIPVVDRENRPIGIISRRGLKHILGTFLGIRDEI
jgi:CBS domain-containing protein